MGKIIVWIVVVFVVLLGLRLLNLAGSKRRRDSLAGKSGDAKPPAKQMVRCVSCGVFLPQADAKRVTDGFVCGEANCTSRH